MSALLPELVGRDGGLPVSRRDSGLIEKQLYLADFRVVAHTVGHLVRGVVVAAYDLVLGCLAADLVVADAESHHVDAHVGWRLIGCLSINAFEERLEYGVDLDVAVVVDRHLSVRLEVERVDHVDVVEVGRRRLVCDVDGMLEREVPDGESLELGIAGMYAPFVLAVELAETHRHLSASRSRCGDDDERSLGLHVVVLSESLVGGDFSHVVGVSVDEVVVVGFDSHPCEPLAELVCSTLSVVVGDDHRSNEKSPCHELIAQAQHVLVVCDSEVGPDLVLLNVLGTDDDDNLDAVADLLEHTQLAVGLESRQHT